MFPIIQEAGFAPVSPDDVLSPGDNVQAKVEALLNRAGAVLVDAGTTVDVAELGWLAYARRAQKPTALVVQDVAALGGSIPEGVRVFKRDRDVFTEEDEFILQVTEWIGSAGRALPERFAEEPERLLSARAYRAAVITAMTLLEVTLRQRLGKENVPRSGGLLLLLRTAMQRELLRPEDYERLRAWMDIRNRLVHTDWAISAAAARALVHGVLDVATRIRG